MVTRDSTHGRQRARERSEHEELGELRYLRVCVCVCACVCACTFQEDGKKGEERTTQVWGDLIPSTYLTSFTDTRMPTHTHTHVHTRIHIVYHAHPPLAPDSSRVREK